MNGTITHRRTSDVETVRELILEIHVEVRGEFGLMGRPFYQRERFDERLTAYSSRPGWEAVIAYHNEAPVGYVFAVPLGENTAWWSAEQTPLPDANCRIRSPVNVSTQRLSHQHPAHTGEMPDHNLLQHAMRRLRPIVRHSKSS